jgi:hypothetical protein
LCRAAGKQCHSRQSPRERQTKNQTKTQTKTGHFSNALTLWLGIKPAPLFFFLFLPPLLLDSAARIDYFVFKRVRECARTAAAGGLGGGGALC